MKTKIKISLLLVLLTLLFSLTLTSCSAGSEVILTKDELYQNVSSETDESRPYVWEYLDAWCFPVFNQSKMKRIERLYRSYYYEEIPSSYEIAVEIANNFLENSYDEIDLQSSQKVSDALLNAFVKAIGDPHSRYRTNEQYDNYSTEMSGVFYGIGVNVIVGFVDDGILVLSPEKYSPADKAGVLANDLIIKIDGKAVAETTYTDAANMLKGEKGSEVVITVKRGEELIDITIERGPIVVPTVDYEIYDGIGYIVINAFRANTDEFFIEAVDHMKENNVKAIIYDVRDITITGHLATQIIFF